MTPAPDSSKIALKGSNGKYVTVGNDGAGLQVTSLTIGNAETFRVAYAPDNTVTLVGSNGKYVSNVGNGSLPLAATADVASNTEKFTLSVWDEKDRVVILASNQKYVRLLLPTGAALQADADELSNPEIFDIIPLSDAGTPLAATATELAAAPPQPANRAALALGTSLAVYTVCFSGTGCTRDEGEVTRPESDKGIYCPKTGYIPIRIHKEISGDLRATSPSVSIRGVGENDWAVPRDNSEPLRFDGPLRADSSLLSYVKSYSGGNQLSTRTAYNGWSASALALHAANLAAASGKQQYNFIGHSRGAVECIMAAWFLYAYGPDNVKNIPVNIFAIDPVPGTGDWYGMLTQLPPNVVNYVGVYAWDMCLQPGDRPFTAVVPRPNGLMKGASNTPNLYYPWWPYKWKYLADKAQLDDPLKPSTAPQPNGYELYACRGRHSTVAGNSTADAQYVAANVSDTVAPVPELVYKMARAYLTKWGTVFPTASAVDERVLALRQKINTDHREFDVMGGGATRTSSLPLRPYVRRVSSIYGLNPANTYYLDNVAGDPPYKMVYPVTTERADAGWVKWKFL